jgi:hypothetical protein
MQAQMQKANEHMSSIQKYLLVDNNSMLNAVKQQYDRIRGMFTCHVIHRGLPAPTSVPAEQVFKSQEEHALLQQNSERVPLVFIRR